MCVLCDGKSIDEYLSGLHQSIAESGFAIVAMELSDDPGLVYTVGLIDRVGHPELVVAGQDLPLAATVVRELARAVVGGELLRAGDEAFVLGAQVGFRRVAESQLRNGLLNMWHNYYDFGPWDRADLVLDAVQVVLPDGGQCYECQTTQPRLDTDTAHISRPNRAQRRASARGRQRQRHKRR
jgi:hypothetical protein